jgi:transcriptional regulator with XRE-family HTH domain
MKKVGINSDTKLYINPDRLKKLRLKKYSQQELSSKINHCKDTISLIERGKDGNPRIGTILEIADQLDCSIDHLCNRDHHSNYLNNVLRKGIKFYNQGLLDYDIVEKFLKNAEHDDAELKPMRRDIIYKLLISDKLTIQSFHHIFCQNVF